MQGHSQGGAKGLKHPLGSGGGGGGGPRPMPKFKGFPLASGAVLMKCSDSI